MESPSNHPNAVASVDGWPPPGHKVRRAHRGGSTADEEQSSDTEGLDITATAQQWREFGMAVLAFHHRVWMTAMCRCGRTVIECDVLHHARELGLLPPLK